MATLLLNAVPLRIDAAILPVDGYREFLELDLYTDAGSANLDLSNATMTLVVAGEMGGTSTLSAGEVAAYTSTGIRITSATAGKCVLNLTKAEISTTLGAGTWHWRAHAAFSSSDASLPSLDKTIAIGALSIGWEAN